MTATTASDPTPESVERDVGALIAVEAIAHVYRQAHVTAIGYFVMGSLLTATLWPHMPHAALLGWLAASGLFSAYRLMLYVAYRRRGPDHPPSYWGRLYARSALYQGLTWGAAAVLLFPEASVPGQVILISLIVAITVVYLALVPYWRSTFYAYALPANTALLLSLLGRGNDYLWLAFTVAAFIVVVSLYARRAGGTVRDALRLRFENALLVEQLEREKAKAEEASHAKTQFLAAASHDLRQPAHTLALLSETLRDEVVGERGQKMMDRLEEAVGSLSGLLASLLDISRLDAGVVVPRFTTVSMNQIGDLLMNEFGKQAAMKGLRLRRHGCADSLRTDPDLLTDILRNLLANAIRYSRRGGVLLGCRRRGDGLLIQVWDTGIGIPGHAQELIFREFQQLHNPERDRNKGLGLGLAICRRLAGILGYGLRVRSVPGKGSVFSLWLPGVLSAAEPTDVPALQRPSAGIHDLAGRRVLLIEDDLSVREATATLLTGWGLDVLAADGREHAKTLASRCDSPIDLIISDYRLRGDSVGTETILAIQRLLGRAVPAVIVTGDTAAQRVRDAYRTGFVLLHKPIRPGELRAVLGKLLEQTAVRPLSADTG